MSIREYLDKLIINCKNRGQLKLLLNDIASIPMNTISGFAEAFYCAATIAYNTHYGELAKDTLAYFNNIGYINGIEKRQLEEIILNSIIKY